MVIPQMVVSLMVMNTMGSQSVQKSPTKQTQANLVGGFNPFETY